MRWELKSIAVWPVIRVSFLYSLVLGLIFGLVAAMLLGFALAVVSAVPSLDAGEFDWQQFPLGAMMVILPLAMSIGGAICSTLVGIVLASVYNLIARVVGGLELNLVEAAAESAVPAARPALHDRSVPTERPPSWRPSPLPPPPVDSPPEVPPENPADSGSLSQM